MNLVLYAKPLPDSHAALVGNALRLAGHRVRFANPRYFRPGETETAVDAAMVFPDDWPVATEIVSTYMGKGTPCYSLGQSLPDPPGYQIASISGDALLLDPEAFAPMNAATPEFCKDSSPGAYRLGFYPGAPPDNSAVERIAKTPQVRGLDSIFSPAALATAPRVILLGGGPSLRGFDYELLRGEVVIGANRAFQSPNVGMMASMDSRFWRWAVGGQLPGATREDWRDYAGFKVFALTEQDKRWEDTIIVPLETEDLWPPRLDQFGHAENSGFTCLQVAWAMGAKEIYMLGFDMKGENGKQAWHHEGYPKVEDESRYALFRRDFEKAAPHLKADGVHVTVFGDSTLKCFERRGMATLKRRLKKKSERPLVVNFATEGTGYVKEQAEMARSAHFFGLDVDDCLDASHGGWQANTCHKCKFLRAELEHYMRPIAWLDADARVRSYPTLFDDFMDGDSDVALAYIDWSQIPSARRNDVELDSATMLLRPTKATFEMLHKWQQLNDAKIATGLFEQENLAKIVEEMGDGLKVDKLPHSYVRIFDLMAGITPVIDQLQASRKLKAEVGA